jgi:hypothetical protein
MSSSNQLDRDDSSDLIESELDSITETVGKPNPPVSSSGITEKKFNIQQSQEFTRSALAGFLMFLLGASIFGVGAYIWSTRDIKDSNTEALKNSRELITLLWTSQVTLTSGALAYYFASNKS